MLSVPYRNSLQDTQVCGDEQNSTLPVRGADTEIRLLAGPEIRINAVIVHLRANALNVEVYRAAGAGREIRVTDWELNARRRKVPIRRDSRLGTCLDPSREMCGLGPPKGISRLVDLPPRLRGQGIRGSCNTMIRALGKA